MLPMGLPRCSSRGHSPAAMRLLIAGALLSLTGSSASRLVGPHCMWSFPRPATNCSPPALQGVFLSITRQGSPSTGNLKPHGRRDKALLTQELWLYICSLTLYGKQREFGNRYRFALITLSSVCALLRTENTHSPGCLWLAVPKPPVTAPSLTLWAFHINLSHVLIPASPECSTFFKSTVWSLHLFSGGLE